MTEDEMKQTWCPDARLNRPGSSPMAYNRILEPHDPPGFVPNGTRCLGRQCSSWRWDDVPNPAYAEFRKKHSSLSLMVDWSTSPPATLKSTTDGHCGRAGRP